MIKATIICDSVAPSGSRLTTFMLKYPRFIHAEFMTHRMFSRNASSSRAIPVKKTIEDIMSNPAVPFKLYKNCRGMQGHEYLEKSDQEAIDVWLKARDAAVKYAQQLADLELHKQHVNRILEPFSHISVVCTATDYNNFFALRCHKDAQPEIQELANEMIKLYISNKPQELDSGEWHLPFITQKDFDEIYQVFFGVTIPSKNEMNQLLVKRSVAKCARVSYNNHDGSNTTLEQDLNLYDKLLGSSPIHASPAEHQGLAISDYNQRSGNFLGWIQYRKTLNNENILRFERYE